MSNENNPFNLDAELLEQVEHEFKEPQMYKVVLLNDDYTPMDFVIEVLMRFFAMDEQKATQIMLHIHTRGKGLCGVFTHEVAETKSTIVNEFSRENEHPLMCVTEVM